MATATPKKPANQMDPSKTRPIGELADGTRFRLFHLKRNCKSKGTWQEYEVEHSRSDGRHVAAVYLPRSTAISMIHMMSPDTPVEVISDPTPDANSAPATATAE